MNFPSDFVHEIYQHNLDNGRYYYNIYRDAPASTDGFTVTQFCVDFSGANSGVNFMFDLDNRWIIATGDWGFVTRDWEEVRWDELDDIMAEQEKLGA